EKSIIRRVIMHSNSPGGQPHTLSQRQQQFNELLHYLSVPSTLPPPEKLAILRSKSPTELLKAASQMKLHQFRATTDGNFIPPTLFQSINTGDFAQRMLDRNITLLTGECRDEHTLYARYYPPAANTRAALSARLLADFTPSLVKVLMEFYSPDGELPRGCRDWGEAFGYVYADVQVHLFKRGFVNAIAAHAGAAAGGLVHRYRVEFRAECVDRTYGPEMGVTHTSDMALWFLGQGERLSEWEKGVARRAFVDLHGAFLRGEDVRSAWGTKGVTEVRRLRPDGEVDVWEDEMWDRSVELWKRMMKAGVTEVPDRAKL
ncbi:hypothetical protein LTS18_004572, partial [Coniosporium uncinatum]